MSKRLNLVGKKFGRLKVLKFKGRNNRYIPLWLCKCDCGIMKIVNYSSLKYGNSKSCGCLMKEILSERQSGNGNNQYKHGLRYTRLYSIWHALKGRCRCNYKNYGDRGIKCLWPNFLSFYNDMSVSYNRHVKKFGEYNTSIERINNNGNYCKKNCRFATRKEQQRNTRHNRIVIYKNKKYCVSELYEKLNPPVKLNVFYTRIIKYKWKIKEALKPIHPNYLRRNCVSTN